MSPDGSESECLISLELTLTDLNAISRKNKKEEHHDNFSFLQYTFLRNINEKASAVRDQFSFLLESALPLVEGLFWLYLSRRKPFQIANPNMETRAT
jgi:hypothetical protein